MAAGSLQLAKLRIEITTRRDDNAQWLCHQCSWTCNLCQSL